METVDVEETTSEEPAVEELVNTNTVDLNIQDLTNLKSIIDMVAQRGVFRPDEFTSVGAVYDKLAVFLEMVARQVGENVG